MEICEVNWIQVQDARLFVFCCRLGGCGEWSPQEVSPRPEADHVSRLPWEGLHRPLRDHLGGEGSR